MAQPAYTADELTMLRDIGVTEARIAAGDLIPQEEELLDQYREAMAFMAARYPETVFHYHNLAGNPLLRQLPGFVIEAEGERFRVEAHTAPNGGLPIWQENYYCAARREEIGRMVRMQLLTQGILDAKVDAALVGACGEEADPLQELEKACAAVPHLARIRITLPDAEVTDNLLNTLSHQFHRCGLTGSLRLAGQETGHSLTTAIREEE